MRPRPIDPDKLATITENAAKLGQLKTQPGWQVLTTIYQREEKRYFDAQFRKMRNGEPVDQEEIRAHRLAFDLVDYLLKHPEKAEATLSRALERAERLGAIREEVTL